MERSCANRWSARLCLLFAAGVVPSLPADAQDASAYARQAFYDNPVSIRLPDGRTQINCADPTIIQGRGADPYWYALCTTDALTAEDVEQSRFHLLPILRSEDLSSWQYLGDAVEAPPSWASASAKLWAPDITFRDGRYYLYYTVTDVADSISGEPGCVTDSAIGVMTSSNPSGPFIDSGWPVVGPRRAGSGCDFYSTFDPDVLSTADEGSLLYYGSYNGGIEARRLSEDGRSTTSEPPVAVTIPNRYEGAEVLEQDDYYYLFVSASDCCNGALTGYQVFVGRSRSPWGPFVDRDGISLLNAQVGGSPVLTLNGNRWVGTGHQTLFRDALGELYAAYHAIDREDPYAGAVPGYSQRALLLDRVGWDGEWPVVRGGLGASDTPQLKPVVQGTYEHTERLLAARRAAQAWLDVLDPESYLRALDRLDVTQLELTSGSDEFEGSELSAAWTLVRPPAEGALRVEGGQLRFATQAAELYADSNDASVLITPVPDGDYVLETKLTLDLPETGCCFNFVQAALLVYANDDAYVKLGHVAIWETRQTEFAKEVPSPAAGYPAYGSGLAGTPAQTTWLRIVKVTRGGEEHYVSYTSRDGVRFTRGPVWTHALGSSANLGLVALGGEGFTALFDYVRVYRLTL